MKSVKGIVFLVTGGAMGMGKLVAERFADDGARVVIWDRDREMLDRTAAEFSDRGWEVHPYVVDIAAREAVYATAARVREEVGVIDVLMNNAGIVKGGPFLQVDDESHLETMDVNFNAVMWTTKAFLPDMMARNRGHIINMASAAAVTSVPNEATYCTSKAAVMHFTDCMRCEMKKYGKKGVRFTIVCPSYVKTGMFEGARPPLFVPWIEPEMMADKIYGAYHKNKNIIYEPFLIKMVPFFRAIMRRDRFDFFMRIMKGSSSMDEWRGRR